MMNRGQRRAQRLLLLWLLVALLAYALLPWYYPQNLTLLRSLGGVFGGSETASGLVQAAQHGKPWLWSGLIGLALVSVAWRMPPGRGQGLWLVAGAGLGLLGLLASAFSIGAQGWSFEWLGAAFGALPAGQFGMGLGGAVVLLALLMLLGAGVARLGYFRGDFFVAGAVVLCSALLLLFVALPVGKSLLGAFLDESGSFAASALGERLMHERVWGLSCVVGGVRCGVAWNTLFLALLTAAGTTVMGSFIALMSERGGKRLAKLYRRRADSLKRSGIVGQAWLHSPQPRISQQAAHWRWGVAVIFETAQRAVPCKHPAPAEKAENVGDGTGQMNHPIKSSTPNG